MLLESRLVLALILTLFLISVLVQAINPNAIERSKLKKRDLIQKRNEKSCCAHLRDYYYYDHIRRLKDCDDDDTLSSQNIPAKNPKICIIGAGISGLFSALLLKEAGIKNITILEAQDRVGGRVHTHYFTEDPNDDRRLYGELGAMRLPFVAGHPELSPHQLVFDTINHLNNYNNDSDSKKIRIIPFILRNPEAMYYFNNRKEFGKVMTLNYSQKIIKENVTQLGYPNTIPDDYVQIWSDAIQPFFNRLNKDFTKGLKYLKRYDEYTAYAYLREVYLPKNYPEKREDYDEIISAIELQVVGVGEFSTGFVTLVIDSYTFENPSPEFELTWRTIDKGMQRFPNAFLSFIKKKRIHLRYNSEVYKLEKTDGGKKVRVHWKTKEKDQYEDFDRVIVACPLGVVRHWDLPLTLSYGKLRAIRELNYANAGKIFLQFKTRFWEKKGQPTTSGVGIVGGASSTDIPVRTVVYPSFYNETPPDGPGVLLASYTWGSDASKYAPYSEEERFELALKDIVTLHGEVAREEWIEGGENNKAHYWTNDKTIVGGAYALYGAGQLGKLMTSMMRSEEFIHWAGDHTDIHTAWIVGALNSGVRVVREILRENLMRKEWAKLRNSPLLEHWNGNLKAFEGY